MPWRRLTWVLLGLSLLVRLATFRDYGVTWDEQLERRNGLATVRWYGSGLTFLDRPEGSDQHLYGSFFNVLAWAASHLSPLDHYETEHLLVSLFGLLAVVAAWRLAESVAGPRAGFLAALVLTLTPVFHGHSFNNPKDAPFAALFALGLWAALRPPEGRGPLLTGVVVGMAAGIRIVGLALLAVPPLVAWARDTRPRDVVRTTAVSAATAVVVALLFWPYLQTHPLTHGLELMQQTAAFGWERTVLFRGAQVPAHDLPRTYLPTWMLVSLPELYAVGLAGLVALRKRTPELMAVAGAFALPVLAAVLLRPVLYDGWRHFLFVVPPLAVLAAVGLDAALDVKPRLVGWAAALLAAVASLAVVRDMVALHPYQSVYFNRAVAGGLPGAAGRYDTDYWGASYKEAAAWLLASYHPGRPVTVANVSNPFFTEYHLRPAPDRFDPVRQPARADVVLAVTRWKEHERWPGTVLHVVEREGVPLCYVIGRAPSHRRSR
jgi:4-amino-4-deoxy-L-arabinose transferase-like glycosyltransferase